MILDDLWKRRNWHTAAVGTYYHLSIGNDGTFRSRSTGDAETADPATDVVQVACGDKHAVALRNDGSVVAFGSGDGTGVSAWSDIIQVAAGDSCSFGLKSDGTVVATGLSAYIAGVDVWTGITQIACGRYAIALKSDGTCVTTYTNYQAVVESWTDIVQVAQGAGFMYGLKSDGTVVTTSDTGTPVSTIANAVMIASSDRSVMAVTNDGKVVAAGYEANFVSDVPLADITDAVFVAGGCDINFAHYLVVKADGTTVPIGQTRYASQYNDTVGVWPAVQLGVTYNISGITSIDGTPTPMTVRAYEETTGRFQIETQSDVNGQYTLRLPRWYNGYIMAIPPAGHRPMAHGPITPPPEDTQV